MSRRININTPVLPDPQIMAWFEANGIDPNNVPAAQEVLVEDGKLTYIEFEMRQTVPGAPPHKTLASDGSGYIKRLRTVPLVSAPEDHNL